jgi:hypothetical protein
MSEAKARELLQKLCSEYHSDGNTKDQKAAFAAARAYLAPVPAPAAEPTRQYWCWKHGAYGEGSCPLCAAEPVAQQPPHKSTP